ncbi:helix-turn-helix domain-containing protein [Rossellomorea aquimaris]|uniref:helix-turn-helix domain-containing protein n=1 Tax=Rossellomorea aquimaris TaxID=189382 RepID=UPI001CD33752|nr:helix-turn-helix transcriptional regulator [Rossellomorea aquimaris]MCA1061470.1 helix-turn-helix domain-containing protein [Rossellomorea aquimaris]
MIGTNISTIRKRRGLTLSELADRANVSKSYLSNLERNLNKNPSIQVLEKISTVLDVDLMTILQFNAHEDNRELLENEWLDFINELKDSGIEKEQLQQYKAVIEFIKWQNQKVEEK